MITIFINIQIKKFQPAAIWDKKLLFEMYFSTYYYTIKYLNYNILTI